MEYDFCNFYKTELSVLEYLDQADETLSWDHPIEI